MSALAVTQSSPVKPNAVKPLLQQFPVSQQRSNIPFVGLIIVLLAVGMGGAIILNTILEQQTRDLVVLQREATSLSNQEATLVSDANQLRSPRVLALKASNLGMVPNPHPVYLKLTDGELLGSPKEVTGEEMPAMTGGLNE